MQSRGCQTFTAPPVAHIDWINAAVPLVAYRDCPAAAATHQQALKQRESFTSCTVQHVSFAVSAIACQAHLILLKFIRGNVSLVMCRQMNAPLRLWYRLHVRAHIPLGVMSLRYW
ncbi:MAG: hypothetical protein CBHOC_5345 [uncultured Caballeronia sp.]|nr:MAG: hypothetical protein CBHOC_5345 [uncultured Caballeronia sp.]